MKVISHPQTPQTRQPVRSVDARAQYEALGVLVRNRRAGLVIHPLYEVITDRRSMRIFMESHVFAVWDFMCLLKFLQGRLTQVSVPWWPTEDADARAFINEIVTFAAV